MTTTLPTEIIVGPFVYTVSTDENEMLRTCREERTDLLGFSDHRLLRILIRPDQADGMARDTMLHEIVHVVASVSGLAEDWGSEREEQIVQRMTPLLLDVLRRNPKLVAHLTA